jgi:hypothetical protein
LRAVDRVVRADRHPAMVSLTKPSDQRWRGPWKRHRSVAVIQSSVSKQNQPKPSAYLPLDEV